MKAPFKARHSTRVAGLAALAALIAGGGAASGVVLTGNSTKAPATPVAVSQKKPIGPHVTLKFETYNTTNDPVTLWAESYAKQVAKDTGGAVQIQVYPNSELVSQSGASTALESDSVQMGFDGLNSIAPTSPAVTGVDLELDPYATVNYAATKAAMQSFRVRGTLNSALNKVNLQLIGSCIQGQNAIVSTKPQENLAQMKGVATRVANTISGAGVAAYGGTPVVIPIGSTYQGFLLHTVDAALSNVNNDYGYSWYQVAKYVNQVGYEWVDVNMFINTHALSSMSKAEQKVVVDDATSSAPSCDAAEQRYDLTVLHAMQDAGVRNTGFSSKAAAKAFENSFNAVKHQESTASHVAKALATEFAQLNKQYS